MSESGATIEQEIAQLEKQLQEKKANLGQQTEQSESLPDKEILREVIGEKSSKVYLPRQMHLLIFLHQSHRHRLMTQLLSPKI